jgi:16S rRNA (uracil1498-N3)-methyltransferase
MESGRLVIRDQDARHLAKVLRLKPGDTVEVLDGAGRAARARVDLIGKNEVECIKLEEFNPGGEPSLKVTLVQGLAKGEKMETIIQKSTELGVSDIIPLNCHRSVVRPDGNKALEKQERWQRVAVEAAKQCRRARVPVVHKIQGMCEVLGGMPESAAAFIPWEEEHTRSFKQELQKNRRDRVYLFIGPEGGFEISEVDEARRRGVVAVTLGSRILRTETAGPACLAILMYAWGDLG